MVFKVKEGINKNPEDPNYDLFKYACKVTALRMFPTYVNLDSTANKPYGLEATAMGCRTRVVANINGPSVGNGRGNIAFVTLNLPRVALDSKKDIDKFWDILDSRLDLCTRQLLHRYNILKDLRVKDIPFNMEYLWLDTEKLSPDDTIEPVLKHGTLSIGFIGLYETLKHLIGKAQHETPEAQELGLKIIGHLRDYCDRLTEKYHLNFSLIATPAESACKTLRNLDFNEYGLVKNVTDKAYYVNSCHVAPFARVTAEEKICLEAPYAKLCNAGSILYVEMDAPPINNDHVVMNVVSYACEADADYFAINFPLDFCDDCNFLGVINTPECPFCGSKDIRRVRRITGYFSRCENFNSGKLAELHDRVPHFDTVLDLPTDSTEG